MIFHFPLELAWLRIEYCLKWSALKNLFIWIHFPEVCDTLKCLILIFQSCLHGFKSTLLLRPEDKIPVLMRSSPQNPHLSESAGVAKAWNTASYKESLAHGHDLSHKLENFWCISTSLFHLCRFLQYTHLYCFSWACVLQVTLVPWARESGEL